MFPSLRTDVPLVRRGPTDVQLGLDADGVVLTGLSPAEARTLAALDGSTPLDLLRRDSSRLAAALDELTERGLIVDAHRSAPAAGRRVAIDGQGATTRLLADLLAEAGVHVVHGPLVLDEIDLAARSGREPLLGERVDVLVRVGAGALSPVGTARVGTDCLPVLVRHRSVTVGPFLLSDGPCAWCLDLARADDDPLWGQVLAQVHRLPEPVAGSPATALAASLACARLVDHVAPRPSTVPASESLEMSLPAGRLTRRRWERHPDCPRHDASDPLSRPSDVRQVSSPRTDPGRPPTMTT